MEGQSWNKMSDYSKIKSNLSKIETLERELNLKKLQINRLLNITQAINNNVSADGLYNMYKSFLGWEVGIKKMALYIKAEDNWFCATHIGISDSVLNTEISRILPKFTRLKNLESEDNPFLKEFDVVIPVRHKEQPIAYVFIGGFEDDEDMYSKVQFITTITNIIAVAIENKRLFKRQLEQERLKKDMELASEIQQMLIPKHFPKKKCYELSSIYKPHFGVGGDYFDFLELEDEKFIFCVGDVSGKGVSAALVMANFQAIFHTILAKRTNLYAFVNDLNKAVNVLTNGERFITLFVAEYDIKKRKLHYVNAGHNPPFFVSNGRIELMRKGCTILGPFEELPFVEVGEVDVVEDQATIMAFTDGLTDLQNYDGAYFDEEILKQFISKNSTKGAIEINDELMNTIEAFRGEQAYPDDITVLTCKIYNADRKVFS